MRLEVRGDLLYIHGMTEIEVVSLVTLKCVTVSALLYAASPFDVHESAKRLLDTMDFPKVPVLPDKAPPGPVAVPRETLQTAVDCLSRHRFTNFGSKEDHEVTRALLDLVSLLKGTT